VKVADRPPPYAGVAFDCDSTLSAIEGIEELARVVGRGGPELHELTRQAMDGEVPLEEVYGRRLGIVRPTRAELDVVGRRYVATALPGARELVRALAAAGKRIWIVSGGLLTPVLALAEHLGVPAADVHAVAVAFDPDDDYAGYAADCPLARAGGKREVLARLAADAGGPIALVGDGATDLEAAPVLARFVAFGGVVQRAAVFERAAVGSTAADLRALAPLLLAPDELARARDLLAPPPTP
jgi:phosphoserine phosphatase